MPEKVTIAIDDLTIGEIIAIETRTGTPIDSLFEDGKPRGVGLQAVAWIAKRRDSPEFTFEQALDLSLVIEDSDPLENAT